MKDGGASKATRKKMATTKNNLRSVVVAHFGDANTVELEVTFYRKVGLGPKNKSFSSHAWFTYVQAEAEVDDATGGATGNTARHRKQRAIGKLRVANIIEGGSIGPRSKAIKAISAHLTLLAEHPMYFTSDRTPIESVQVTKVHSDGEGGVYYTIFVPSSERERQTDASRLGFSVVQQRQANMLDRRLNELSSGR